MMGRVPVVAIAVATAASAVGRLERKWKPTQGGAGESLAKMGLGSRFLGI